MKETLKMMRSIIIGYEKNKTINELLREYKDNESPNILAYLYVTNFGIIQKYADKYKMIDTQDIASYSLQELDKAIKQYDFNSNCKFITFFVTYLKNRLRSEQELLMKHVRFANYFHEDLDSLHNITSNFEFDLFDLNNYNLNLTERRQCKMLLDGYTSVEIANIFNITKQAVYKRNNQIAKKLSAEGLKIN